MQTSEKKTRSTCFLIRGSVLMQFRYESGLSKLRNLAAFRFCKSKMHDKSLQPPFPHH